MRTLVCLLAPLFLAAACQPAATTADRPVVPGTAGSSAWAGVGPDETLRFTGTEPFWGGSALGTSLVWQTPDNQAGTTLAVRRFAGRNGLGLSGTLNGKAFEMAVSEAACSDGMSDRSYPFTVTVRLGGETLRGCGWTARRPFEGPQQP